MVNPVAAITDTGNRLSHLLHNIPTEDTLFAPNTYVYNGYVYNGYVTALYPITGRALARPLKPAVLAQQKAVEDAKLVFAEEWYGFVEVAKILNQNWFEIFFEGVPALTDVDDITDLQTCYNRLLNDNVSTIPVFHAAEYITLGMEGTPLRPHKDDQDFVKFRRWLDSYVEYIERFLAYRFRAS